MKKIFSWFNESSYVEPLSPACEMCAAGSKMVLLITGLCPSSCFYCPLSLEKSGKDRIFADEWELETEEDTEKLLLEAKYINATGAGITGGDPFVVWKRTQRYITLLKDNFGSDFHIHLYTSGIKNVDKINDFVSAGLDEIRFHPVPNNWDKIKKTQIADTIKKTLETDVDVAIEIPSIPGMENEIFSLVNWADDVGVKWVNLNELEFSETNAEQLKNKGYTLIDDVSSAVKGSQDTAYCVLDMASKNDLDIGIHYCSSSFKDGIQLRNRIKRRAKNIAKKYEIISDDGTLLKGVIFSQKTPLKELYIFLKQEYEIEDDFVFLNKGKNRIEIGLWILEKIAIDLRKKGFECFMIEEYPTADALEVERMPLPL